MFDPAPRCGPPSPRSATIHYRAPTSPLPLVRARPTSSAPACSCARRSRGQGPAPAAHLTSPPLCGRAPSRFPAHPRAPCPGSAQLLLAAKTRPRANHVGPPRVPRGLYRPRGRCPMLHPAAGLLQPPPPPATAGAVHRCWPAPRSSRPRPGAGLRRARPVPVRATPAPSAR
nr:translation initiation factor IF-2-like [Aegilops tauschii subsp. strangulata]